MNVLVDVFPSTAPNATVPARPVRVAKGQWLTRVLDLMLASVLVVLTWPLLLLVAILVRLTSRGPALYIQTRVGKAGKPFRIYKFRTMQQDAEKGGAQWSPPGDCRITKLGHILRITHLDELPQLFNVLLGHMSLVGPRPERPEFVPQLALAIPGYADRLLVRPGVTGLAQVHLPGDTDLESVRRKLRYDCWYIENRTLWLDIRLIVCTALKMFCLPMTFCRRMLWLPNPGRTLTGNPGPSKTPTHSRVLVGSAPPSSAVSLPEPVPQMEGIR